MDNMEHLTECLVCGENIFKTIARKGHYFTGEAVNMCMKCGLVFLSPRMSPKELERYYEDNVFSRQFRGDATPSYEMIQLREQRAERKYCLIKPYLSSIPDRRILEIGCSNGYLLKRLEEEGYHVFGIDPSSGFLEYAKQVYGLNVSKGMFPEDISDKWGKRYGLIVALHVLEHTHNPRAILEEIYTHLHEEGFAVIEVPDIARIADTRLYIHSATFQKSHLWDFSAYTLTRLMNDCGFKIHAINHYSRRSPDDKNLLIVAGKNACKLQKLPCHKMPAHKSPRILSKKIKLKLLLGKILAR